MNNPFAPILADDDISIDMDQIEEGHSGTKVEFTHTSIGESNSHSTTPEVEETSGGMLHSISATLSHYASISDALRMLGAMAVAGGMGMFLLDGLHVVNDLQRFMTMLGFSVLLTTAGLTMSKLLQEQRGSRVFIALALLSVPVIFTVLGALLYSVFPWDGLAGAYPEFAHWQIGDTGKLLGALVAGAVVIMPVVWLGLSVMARSSRSWLSVGLLLSSATLLIPVRHDIWVAVLALSTTGALWWMHARYADDAVALKTPEGRFALGILFLPPIIVVSRSLLLYDVSGVLGLALSLGIYLSVYRLLLKQPAESLLAGVYTVIGGVSGLMIGVTLFNLLDTVGPAGWQATALIVAAAHTVTLGAVWLIHHKAGVTKASRAISLMCIALLSSSIFFATAFYSSSLALVIHLVLLVGMVAYSIANQYKAEMVMTAISAGLIVMFHAEDVVDALLQTGWWGVALAGVVAIVCGSLLERIGPAFSFQKLKSEFFIKSVSESSVD